MNLWLALNAGFIIRHYHVELSISVFEWMFKKEFDKHRGIYFLYVGPFGIYVSDDRKVDEFLKSIKTITVEGLNETDYRFHEEDRPHGQPLN